jgi:ribosomal 50S subunit-associated protein YjgA (DUF615 family)
MKNLFKDRPPIIYGAGLLAVASLIWSAYSITDLMDSGFYGLAVALAGDIGWITVLWAEAHGVTIGGHRWPAVLAGWLIAVGVGVLLAIHGAAATEHATAQAIAGPFVVAVGKLVWLFALAALRDPAALTSEQQAEIHDVMRSSAHIAQLHEAGLERLNLAADAEIARIRAEARTTLARDDADFEVSLERQRKRAELQRRTPLALPPASSDQPFERAAEQTIEVVGEQPEQIASTPSTTANTIRDQIANNAATSANADREQPSIADLVREQIANTPNNADAVRAVMTAYPNANKDSVAAAVRRERRERRKQGPYL